MNWIPLTEESQLDEIREKSFLRPQVIFKHSTRCNISSIAMSRLQKEDQPDGMDFYYLDLLKYRSISNKIASDFQVHHESPQIILIKNGEVVYDESHLSIDMDEIREYSS